MQTDIDYTRSLLEKLKYQTSEQISDFLEEAVRESLSPHELLNRVLEAEVLIKEEKRVRTNLKFSGLPVGKTLENFDFSFQPSINKNKIITLATCEFIQRKENLLIFGPPGVGKSHLATGIGVKAIKNGFSVVFVTLDKLIERLKYDEEHPLNSSTRRHRKSHLVIVDEVGYRPLSQGEANLFFSFVSRRYETASIIITSNKSVREWPQMFSGDEILASAVLDRLLHHAYAIFITGMSYRLKDKEMLFKE